MLATGNNFDGGLIERTVPSPANVGVAEDPTSRRPCPPWPPLKLTCLAKLRLGHRRSG
jgi:hypothetical protein